MNPGASGGDIEHAKQADHLVGPDEQLGCHVGLGRSVVAGTHPAAGRSPEMSLAFALAAAINGSTGSRATLSFGLERTKPRRRLSGGSMILIPQGWRRKPPETLSRKPSASWTFRGFGTKARFLAESFQSQKSGLSRLKRSQKVSRNGGCQFPTTGLVCATACRGRSRPPVRVEIGAYFRTASHFQQRRPQFPRVLLRHEGAVATAAGPVRYVRRRCRWVRPRPAVPLE